jgi:uncharacterized protein YbjT (DUF2867 family)
MSMRILILGATGTLGRPVTRSLLERGHSVRILTRNAENARKILGGDVEVVEGDSTRRTDLMEALADCEGVHVSLPLESELTPVANLVGLVEAGGAETLKRVSYISGTSVREENRWFDVVDVKMRAEELLKHSGIPHTVFCPTWVMEVLANFVRPGRAVVIEGKTPPGLHFFAAADLGRMLAASYDDDRSLGKRLFIHGPASFTLPDAIRRFHEACFPQVKLRRLRPWQARLVGKLTRNPSLVDVARLIAYFDTTEEHGNPAEANALLGAPTTTLEEWIRSRNANQKIPGGSLGTRPPGNQQQGKPTAQQT